MRVTIRDPYTVPGEYRKRQLHRHTTGSDGRYGPPGLLRIWKDARYAFVLICPLGLPMARLSVPPLRRPTAPPG